MSISISSFGWTQAGQPVDRLELINRNGLVCRLITFGAAVQALLVPSRQGQLVDVVLGYDTLDRYESPDNPSHGAIVGRHANRIEGAAFTLNGVVYRLMANEGRNNLHSSPVRFDRVIWTYEVLDDGGEPAVRFHYQSPDGESGFPGNLTCRVVYRLTADNTLLIEYEAVADQDTVVNLTNHAYFNLNGHASGDVLGHRLSIAADEMTPVNAESLPDGRIVPVASTPFDFRTEKAVGQDIASTDEQMRIGHGYDHNFVLRQNSTKSAAHTPPRLMPPVHPCAVLYAPESGITMTVETTSPGVQLYTGNFLDEKDCKDGATYQPRFGLCLETHYFPNSLRHSHFPSPVLKAGQFFRHLTACTFTIQ